MHLRIDDQTGVTLIEALITLFVISFSTLALARLETAVWRNQSSVAETMEGIRLAAETIDELRTHTDPDTGTHTAIVEIRNSRYQLDLRTSQIGDRPLLQNEIMITWGEPSHSESLRLGSVILPVQPATRPRWVDQFIIDVSAH